MSSSITVRQVRAGDILANEAGTRFPVEAVNRLSNGDISILFEMPSGTKLALSYPPDTPALRVCGFCKGQPVGNAASWSDGKPRPAAACPRCGVTTPYPEHQDGCNCWACNPTGNEAS